jgi:hypothetical protein
LTADEVNRFSEALKKKEYIVMIGDYMKEISDPANKAKWINKRSNMTST